jgi:hypothetical protein
MMTYQKFLPELRGQTELRKVAIVESQPIKDTFEAQKFDSKDFYRTTTTIAYVIHEASHNNTCFMPAWFWIEGVES